MGMWNFIRRMAAGKPVFEESPAQARDDNLQPGWNDENAVPGWKPEATQPKEPHPSQAPLHSHLVDERGRKIIPQLAVSHCNSHANGEKLDVTVWFTNDSPVEIEIEKFTLLGLTTRIGRRLQPGQGHEVRCYHGNMPKDDTAKKAQMFYKIVENGDEFRADYFVEYFREPSGTYLVEEFHPEPYVHDVGSLI